MGPPLLLTVQNTLAIPFLELELLSGEPVSTGELFLHYRIKKME